MVLGKFMGKTFTVSAYRIFTLKNLKGSTGSDWAVHDTVGAKSRRQYIAPQLKSYQLDIELRAEYGVNPRSLLSYFQRKAEAGYADYFVIGGKPLSSRRFVITSISDEWENVTKGGRLLACNISMTVEEYV